MYSNATCRWASDKRGCVIIISPASQLLAADFRRREFHGIIHPQGHAMQADLRTARPDLTKEERNPFLYKGLGLALLILVMSLRWPPRVAWQPWLNSMPASPGLPLMAYRGRSPADSLSRVQVSFSTTVCHGGDTWSRLAEVSIALACGSLLWQRAGWGHLLHYPALQ